jgi:hypothetical protein
MHAPMQAAQDALAIALRYAQSGRSLVHAALSGASRCETLVHYPKRDVVDAVNGTRMYYHAHGSRNKPGLEHGHFHIFSHGQTPSDFMHLVGLSLNAMGEPIRLFTTNRWVTAEHWRPANQMQAALDGFEICTRGRLAPVARWITAMVCVYRPQIAQLLHRRDALMAAKAQRVGWDAVWEDRRLDVLTQCAISWVKTVQQRGS